MTGARPRRVGIDFDNTLVRYDAVFSRVAQEQGLIPAGAPASKLEIRDGLRRAGRENVWTEMQGLVYGTRMAEAEAFPGAIAFLDAARENGLEIFIVSHRTRHPALGPPYDLHRAAREWVAANLQTVVAADHVYFETTKEEKVQRIAELRCEAFVDDLPELLRAPAFPSGTRRILFDPAGSHSQPDLETIHAWSELLGRLER